MVPVNTVAGEWTPFPGGNRLEFTGTRDDGAPMNCDAGCHADGDAITSPSTTSLGFR
jgi:hypothetical protein